MRGSRRLSDLKIVARAVEARRVPEEVPKRILALAVGVGLVISVFLAFFLEYLEKAKDRLAQET
jgi:capsular polysaccharide biosynthesis protein